LYYVLLDERCLAPLLRVTSKPHALSFFIFRRPSISLHFPPLLLDRGPIGVCLLHCQSRSLNVGLEVFEVLSRPRSTVTGLSSESMSECASNAPAPPVAATTTELAHASGARPAWPLFLSASRCRFSARLRSVTAELSAPSIDCIGIKASTHRLRHEDVIFFPSLSLSSLPMVSSPARPGGSWPDRSTPHRL
jgi:hypothetical protein